MATSSSPSTREPAGASRVESVKEQLLYEMGDPREYITPDCIADFTTIHLAQAGPDRVRFSGIKGRAATEFYKVSISYSAGFKAIGSLVYAWPDAYKKARAAEKILRQRLDRLGLRFDAMRAEFLGANACHGIAAAEPTPEIEPHLAEVVLRFGVRGENRAAVERFTREIPPLALNGPPVVSGLGQRTAAGGGDRGVLARADSEDRSSTGGDALAKRKLIELAHARSGDKGDTSNIGIDRAQARVLSDSGSRSHGRTRQTTFRGSLFGQGGALRGAESGRAEFSAA